MSFWADKIREQMPTPPPPPTAATVAPGAWWQQAPAAPTATAAPAATVPTTQYPASVEYRPPEARSTVATDRCPRCGSDEYAEVAVDMTMGGASYGGAQLLSQTGGKVKRCFDCRYPSFDASGDIIKGKGIRSGGNDAVRQNVRQQGNPKNGSWGGQSTWDSAPLVV